MCKVDETERHMKKEHDRGTMKKFTESQLKVAVVTKDNAEQLKDIETIELGMALEQQEQWRQISNL